MYCEVLTFLGEAVYFVIEVVNFADHKVVIFSLVEVSFAGRPQWLIYFFFGIQDCAYILCSKLYKGLEIVVIPAVLCTVKNLEAIDQSMYFSGFSCTLVASISVISMISVVLSGYRCVPLFVHSGLLLQAVWKRVW